MDRKNASRMLDIPQLSIPHILVDDEPSCSAIEPRDYPGETAPRWTQLSAGEGAGQRSTTSQTDVTLHDTTYQHPLSYPRSSDPVSTSRQGSTSGFSFELYEPDAQNQSAGRSSGRDSGVNPTETRDMLDDSVWMESIRRSATLRRPDRGTYRYGDLG